MTVKIAASEFVEEPDNIEDKLDPKSVGHVLFSLRPKDETKAGRMIFNVYMATNRIKDIILYAAVGAKAQERIKFYRAIVKQPTFRKSAGQMFERLFLSWLASAPDVGITLQVYCATAKSGQPSNLQIPACKEERTVFFDSLTALKGATVDGFPSCFLPSFPTLAAVNAIIFTNNSLITVQVTISDRHSAEKSDLDDINKSLPSGIIKDPWYHVIITDNDMNAWSLRRQTMNGLPEGPVFYSGVFDLSRSDITLAEMKAFDEKKVVSGF
jgi:hypothetical protein